MKIEISETLLKETITEMLEVINIEGHIKGKKTKVLSKIPHDMAYDMAGAIIAYMKAFEVES